jgi:transmembrane sensor
MSKSDEIEDLASRWIVREDRGLSPGDVEARDQWLAQSAGNRVAYLRLKAAWLSADRLAALKSPASIAERSAPPDSFRRHLKTAAAAVVCFSAAASAILYYQGQGDIQDTYTTSVGQRKTIRLADGSQVELNTDTQIHTRLERSGRAVTLDHGEAFFDVVHDGRRPFTVFVNNRRITDVGTRFSVFRDGDHVEVVVNEGRVRMDKPSMPADHPVLADKNDVILARADETLVVAKGPQEIARMLDWRQGMIFFDQETLADAASQFNRYNQKKIIVEGAARYIRIGGTFKADNVNIFTHLVRKGFGLKVDESDNGIVISKQ